jgi:hypothetical protein
MFGNIVIFYGQELLALDPTYQSGGPPLVGCPRLLIPCIRSCRPYLKAVSPTATWGCAMTWWQGSTNHGEIIEPVKITQSETLKAPLKWRMSQETNKKKSLLHKGTYAYVVSVVYRLQNWQIVVRFSSATASGVSLGPIRDAPSSEIKRPRCEGDHPPPSNAEVKNEWKYTTPTLLHTHLWRAQEFYISQDYGRFIAYM